jgi:hypothetical protein
MWPNLSQIVWETNTILNSLKNIGHPQILRHPTLSAWFIIQQILKLTGLMLSWAQIHMLMVVLATLYKQKLMHTLMTYQQCHIPAVPCKRVFSSGKETMSAHRSRIKYDLMEALQMLKFSLNHNPSCKLNFTVGSGRQAELHELEELNHNDSIVPENLVDFQHRFTLSLEDNDSDFF